MPFPEEIEHRYYVARGFEEQHARAVRAHYLQYVAGREFLLELGCGRGEFLELAADEVARVVGVDRDPEMVAAVRAAGHECDLADVVEWVRDTDVHPDAVFMAHLVEHLDVETAFGLFADLHAMIRPGGVFIVVTPNPASLANLLNDFWSDPTHQRLYTLELLSFLLGEVGFEVLDQRANPTNAPGPPPELLAPPEPEPWGAARPSVPEPAPIQYDESFQLETILDELQRLRRGLDSIGHWVTQLDERIAALRHHGVVLAERHDRMCSTLWAPNEIYVVASRP